MHIKEITNKSTWDTFFNNAGSPSFLHSWEWAEFENRRGHKTTHIGIYEDTSSTDQSLHAIALIIKMRVKRGSFLYIPHGPITRSNDIVQITNIFTALHTYLIDLAKKEKYTFIRIAPSLTDSPEYRELFNKLGFFGAPIYIHSERFWVLDLEKFVNTPKSEEELLNDMRKTTRYCIRKASKEQVIIEKRTDQKALEEFWTIYEETVKREHFSPYPKKYINDEFEIFQETNNSLYLLANHIPNSSEITTNYPLQTTNSLLAGALLLFTNSTAFYHQGASTHSKIPAPYLLHWEGIKEAIKRGCRYYNFYGIAPDDNPKHPWAGLTLFKTGFGGNRVDYVPTQDYVIHPKYYFTYIYETWLKWRRKV
ncbi:MAG: peptidoglycan bridge formation glycyltransferase FemA/FemB family protein [Candidatus Roizmanbacteria bacterium]